MAFILATMDSPPTQPPSKKPKLSEAADVGVGRITFRIDGRNREADLRSSLCDHCVHQVQRLAGTRTTVGLRPGEQPDCSEADLAPLSSAPRSDKGNKRFFLMLNGKRFYHPEHDPDKESARMLVSLALVILAAREESLGGG